MSRLAQSQAAVRVPPEDGRSADARFLRRAKAALSQQIGEPTATQGAIIEQAAWLQLYLRKLNESALANGGVQAELQAKQYVSYSESLMRALTRLGLEVQNNIPGPSSIRSGIAA